MATVESLIPLGELVTTHGLDGWLKLNPFNPNTSMLVPGATITLEVEERRASFEIEDSKPHKKQFLLKLRDVNTIDAAKRWVGSTLSIAESALELLAPGQYYHYQVIGFEVAHVNGERIGTISSVIATPGGEIYVVQGAGKEHLIPAVSEIVEKVDFTAGQMVINPPAGLLDL
ncbi:MAG TPA: ribosome maturation factor RimM [Candidatus Limnocylindria bacterium]|nr:ribosome maturation factor RimM [Candidatus Limnocylindria bacterium]